jgi:hypothetical protein
MKEIAISKASRMEIEYDITNGLFSADYEVRCKCYRDEENDLLIEVQSEFKYLTGAWLLNVVIYDNFDNKYTLEEGQWSKLYKALMGDVEWREKETRSEAQYVKHLWRTAYA